MPYLIGVHSSLMEVSELKLRLKRYAACPGCGVARAFLRAQAQLFGGYKNALQLNQEGTMWFCEELYLDHSCPSMKQFLQSAVHLQFFKQPRPRRPAQKPGTPRNDDKALDTQINCQGLAAQPDPELERDEVEDPLLCDPEEMDLLGEIFDTLSSRSSREHGPLYETRSLDLFGPDSHDYIIKDRLATPSQESLFLSISRSESLCSWTPEDGLQTTEKESELAKECDWLCSHSNLNADKELMPVMCPPAEQGRNRATPNKQAEVEQGGGQEQNVNEVTEKQKQRNVENNAEIETGHVIEKGGSREPTGESVENQINGLEVMLQEVHVNNDDTERRPSQGTRLGPCTESDVSLEPAENQNQSKTDPGISFSVGEQNEPMSRDVQPTRATPRSLTIGKPSPVTHQCVMLQNQSQTKLWRLFNSNNSSCVQDDQTESTEKELKAVKVLELKKRFEHD
ncbi:hypothetical protein NHX12_018072 [Muraenolepis orangiensis]|uniref:dDENN domain-containing protein n=1 Tax=Muraenolepis orangiensis TaxID=630683 RepID=A0A9Q0IXN9_9TELE|nr:hypothetical protein NHX12_018072 [Muraenolepis orangiensis]